MANMTTTSDITINVTGFYDRNLIERALPALLYSQFGQTRPIPKNRGSLINFRKYGSLVVNTTALTEGVTPAAKKLSHTDIQAVMNQYGDYVIITDQLLDMGLDPILIEAGEILGEQAGLSIDTIHRDKILAGTSVRYAGGVAGRSSIITTVQLSDIKKVIRSLEAANAKKIREINVASTKISTHGIRPGFIGITHTDCRQDFEELQGFRSIEEYSSQKDVMQEEFGEIRGIRCIATTNAGIVKDVGGSATTNNLVFTTANTSCDVYQTLVIAKNAYGIIPLQKGNIENIIKRAASSGTDDPLSQRNTSAWKAYTTAIILNDNFLIRVEHGVTDV